MKPYHHQKILTLFILLVLSAGAAHGDVVRIPDGVSHDPWDQLVRKYVDDRGMVDYRGWHANEADRLALRRYLADFSRVGADPETQSVAYRAAALTNLYNAITIAWILENFPTESIRKTRRPWKTKRHPVGGRDVSLDEIEHDTLRPLIGWEVHSIVVCAARSCPPLLNRAYREETWKEQMRERYTAWFAREDLNRFSREEGAVYLSKIFDWYAEDFEGDTSLRDVLVRFAPEAHRAWLRAGDFRVKFLDYHWGLNAQSDLGSDYSHGWF